MIRAVGASGMEVVVSPVISAQDAVGPRGVGEEWIGAEAVLVLAAGQLPFGKGILRGPPFAQAGPFGRVDIVEIGKLSGRFVKGEPVAARPGGPDGVVDD